MGELLTKFLDKIGTPTQLREQLLADEPKGDFDFDAAMTNYLDDRREVWKTKLKDDVSDQIKNKEVVLRKQLARKLAKSSNLDIPGNKAEELGFDKVAEMVVEKINAAGSSNDDQLKKQLEETKAKLTEWQEKHETAVSDHKKKLEEAEKGYNDKIAGYDRDRAFSSVFGQIEYGVDKKGRTLFESHVRNVLTPKYQIAADMSLLAPDGTGAISLDGEGIYKTLLEPVMELAKEFGVLKESNGNPSTFQKRNLNQPGSGSGSGSGEGDEKKFTATNALAARMEAAKKKRGR